MKNRNFSSTAVIGLHARQELQLVKKLLADDQHAFKSFSEEYIPKLYRYAVGKLRDAQAAEEVVQATLAAAVMNLENFRGEATLLTWLISICRNEMSAFITRSKKDYALFPSWGDSEMLQAALDTILVPDETLPENIAVAQELSNLVRLSLDNMPENQAKALEWKYMLGFSSKEIAAKLALSDEAVQSLLARARRSFKGVFTEVLEFAAD